MKYLILFCLFCCEVTWCAEELVIIQTISVDQKSFVIGKGLKDGISKGQELIFANENVSLVCKAVEVNRDYSYWHPMNENMTVPFLREEIVSTSSHIYGSIGLDVIADQNKLIETYEANEKKIQDLAFFRNYDHYNLRASLGAGLTQNTSSVAADQAPKRVAYEVSLEYSLRFRSEYELGAGIRVDRDVYRLSNPTLDIPTTRILALASATYHFFQWSSNKNNIYISLVAGIGSSVTVVDQATNSGYATILPQARLGYIMPFSKTSALIIEATVESVSAKEKLPDSTVQTTSYSNIKGAIGITF